MQIQKKIERMGLRRLVIDHQREKRALCHTQKPPNGEETAKVVNCDNKNRANTKGKHHAW